MNKLKSTQNLKSNGDQDSIMIQGMSTSPDRIDISSNFIIGNQMIEEPNFNDKKNFI